MRRPARSIVFGRALCIFVALAFASFSFAATPTSEELHQLYDQHKDAELLKAIRDVLALKDQSKYDRYDLLTLRGESLLRTKSDGPAADAFRDAAKAAKSDEQASLARATEYLLRKSRNQAYTPKPHDTKIANDKPDPIPLIDPDSRKKAFAALLSDELSEKSSETDAAKKASALDPILSLAPTIQLLRDIEHASNGKTEKSSPIMVDLGEHARDLMKTAEQTMDSRIDELERIANVKDGILHEDGTITRYKRGLSTPQTQELHDIADTCQKIRAACDQLHQHFGKDGGNFSQTVTAANTAQTRAMELIKKHAPRTGKYANPKPKE
jgi:hypothetical protein